MSERRGRAAGELIPLAERIAALSALRAAAVAVIGVLAALGQLDGALRPGPVVAAGAAYWAVAAAAGRSSASRRRLPLFGVLLLCDGLALQALVYLSGGTASPLRYLVLVQVAVVALVASYRTGLKLAIWQCLLLLTLQEAVTVGILPPTGPRADESPLAFTIAIWAVTLATTTASAVNERELRRRRIESEALAHMATELERRTTPVAVAEELARAVVELFELERAAVLDLRDRPAVLAAAGPAQAVDAPMELDPLVTELCTRREPVLVTHVDATRDPWLAAVLGPAEQVALLPLSNRDAVVGALVLAHGARAGSRLERRVLATAERVADHGALALSNAWLQARLAELATTDGLTGLANRRMLDEALRANLSIGEPLGVLLVDLDHFKQINDVHGHAVGDEVLTAVGAVIRDAVPVGALAARYGGEELAVLALTRDLAELTALAEDLRERVATAPTPVRVTASIGVAHTSQCADPAAVVEAADGALYAAKRAGRNRVMTATPAAASGPTPPPHALLAAVPTPEARIDR